jgi:DNA-binding transcriptional ArsR family regulator
MAMSKSDKNKAVILALSHPLRRGILEKLDQHNNGGMSPSDLAKELEAPLGNVSYHVRQLEKAKVLKLVKTLPRRGAVEHFYKRAGNAADKKISDVLEFIGKDWSELNDAERIAKAFHDKYEELAPDHGYETRPESRKEWGEVPEQNKGLMVAVVEELIEEDVIQVGQERF